MTPYEIGQKIAMATRLEKEIAKGNVRREKILPDMPSNLETPWPESKAVRMTRDKLLEPASIPTETLNKTRKLNDKLFNTQIKHPESFGLPGEVNVTRNAGGTRAFSYGGQSEINVGKDVAKQLRDVAANSNSSYAGTTNPVDPTLEHAALRHELGEAYHGQTGKNLYPMESNHLGVRPHLEEQMALRSDPDAANIFQKWRETRPADTRLRQLIRRAGGTRESPLPVGGKAENTLTRMMAMDPLTPPSRGAAGIAARLQRELPNIDVAKYINLKNLLSKIKR